MWKLTKIILIIVLLIILLIVGLFLLTSAYLEKQLGGFEQLSSEGEYFQESSDENQYYKEFISPSKNLKLNYLSNWKEIEDKKFLEEIILKDEAKKYNLKILFLAWKIKSQTYSELTVVEGYFDSQKNHEEIIDIMKEINRKGGEEMEILKSEIKDNEILFEAKYKKLNRLDLYSKEKIILLDPKEEKRKIYIIAFKTYDKNWQELKEEANEIIDSVQLINQIML